MHYTLPNLVVKDWLIYALLTG